MQASIATSSPSLKLPTKVTHDLHLSGTVLVLEQEVLHSGKPLSRSPYY